MDKGGVDIKEEKIYSSHELSNMTINEIKQKADSLNYDLKSTLKADLISEFLEKQGG